MVQMPADKKKFKNFSLKNNVLQFAAGIYVVCCFFFPGLAHAINSYEDIIAQIVIFMWISNNLKTKYVH